MPIWLPGFLQFLDWRRLFSQLEEELSRYRFILEPIFYRLGEDNRPDFVDRILKFNPDISPNLQVRAPQTSVRIAT